jgi:hypothetical protein
MGCCGSKALYTNEIKGDDLIPPAIQQMLLTPLPEDDIYNDGSSAKIAQTKFLVSSSHQPADS